MTDWQNANFNVNGYKEGYEGYVGPLQFVDQYIWSGGPYKGGSSEVEWTIFAFWAKEPGDGIVGYRLDGPGDEKSTGVDQSQYYITNGFPTNVAYSSTVPSWAIYYEPYQKNPTQFDEQIREIVLGTVYTHDWVTGHNLDDSLFLGPGNDRLDGNGAKDTLVGGSDNDLVYGGDGSDLLHGDFADAPVMGPPPDGRYPPFTWTLPAAADPNVVEGNDSLYGQSGNDTIFGEGGDDILHGDDDSDVLDGGAGNDQLYGGLRGKGWTDKLTGGDGADIFYLSYEMADTDTDSEEVQWWQEWFESVVTGTGKNAVKETLTKLTEEAAAEVFETFAGGMVIGAAIDAVADLAKVGLESLFEKSPPAPPPPTTEDVMVITDFDPRADVLFLPTEENKSLIADVSFYASAAVSGVSGWGAKFQDVDGKVFAEVFLDPDFLGEFSLRQNDAASLAFLDNLFNTALVVTSGTDPDTGGIQSADSVYPFPDDPSQYSAGQVPVGVAETLALSAPPGRAPS